MTSLKVPDHDHGGTKQVTGASMMSSTRGRDLSGAKANGAEPGHHQPTLARLGRTQPLHLNNSPSSKEQQLRGSWKKKKRKKERIQLNN